MDRESIEVLSRLKKESSIEMNLSGIYREAVELEKKEFFKGGKTQILMQQIRNLTKYPINMLSSQNVSQHICKAYIDPKHTRTKQV